MPGTLKAKDPVTGQWIVVTREGAQGNPGVPGPPFLIVDSFGVSKTPADLPVGGAIPVDWDEPGKQSWQMRPGMAMYYNPADETLPDAGDLYEFVGTMQPSGWTNVGHIQGPKGPTGVSTIIVGSFGAVQTPAGLPPDGLIPVDWDGPGKPAVADQMTTGESLYYDPVVLPDPLDGHLYQFVGTTIDPLGWIDVGLIQGPEGPTGPEGPIGPPSEEVLGRTGRSRHSRDDLWYDTDDARLIGPYDLPPNGATYDVLAKTTDLDGDIGWRNVYSVPSGKVIQFPNVADVAKIQLYSTTFGLGITGSTLNLFSSANIKFNQNSITGTELANIHTTGMTLRSGHLYFPTDGHGVRFMGDGYIYKKVGSGMKLRKASGNTNIQIENNDGGGGRDIATTPDSEATVAHNATNFDGVRAGQELHPLQRLDRLLVRHAHPEGAVGERLAGGDPAQRLRRLPAPGENDRTLEGGTRQHRQRHLRRHRPRDHRGREGVVLEAGRWS